jgi:hypothetical protein
VNPADVPVPAFETVIFTVIDCPGTTKLPAVRDVIARSGMAAAGVVKFPMVPWLVPTLFEADAR